MCRLVSFLCELAHWALEVQHTRMYPDDAVDQSTVQVRERTRGVPSCAEQLPLQLTTVLLLLLLRHLLTIAAPPPQYNRTQCCCPACRSRC